MTNNITLVVLAIVGVIAPTITAMATWRQSKKNGVIATDSAASTNTLIEKADQIHGLVNGARMQLVADLAVANGRIQELESVIRSMTERRRALSRARRR